MVSVGAVLSVDGVVTTGVVGAFHPDLRDGQFNTGFNAKRTKSRKAKKCMKVGG